ncbi:hypothetical protein SDC9_156805 [bioreactor metagenome]|uniref:Uncharacterized protein n=1 Tax=bioreactor metagenome TaxID=1076179 RepID=A0A645FAD1_9ZZZZ
MITVLQLFKLKFGFNIPTISMIKVADIEIAFDIISTGFKRKILIALSLTAQFRKVDLFFQHILNRQLHTILHITLRTCLF